MHKLRHWTWTSAPPSGTGLPFGPLRFRAWTSAQLPAALPFGPLRFRAWTSGAAVVPPEAGAGGGGRLRPPRSQLEADRAALRRIKRDDELLLFVISGAASIGALD